MSSGSVSLFALMGKIAVDGVEQTTKDLENVSKSGKETEGALSTSFTNIANKAGDLGKKVAIGLGAIATAAVATVEGTKEFRQDLGKLETTFKTTNQATGAAEQTFKALFGVLGEDDTSIEAANHLAMITNNEKDLNQWTDILTGVYATFGDSLPLEGLAEAANETMRVGQVTGPLADALNWAGINEDAFNEKLLECTSNQEREALIRETLNGLYGEAATEYQNVNGSVIDNNKAQAELNLKMAETAEKLEPMITQGKVLIAEILSKLQPFITWAIDNINILAPIVLTFLGTLFAMGIAGKIASFINTVKTLKTAFAALNLTMSLNPIGLVIAAVVALIAIFVTLWNNCEGFREFWINLWENIKEVAGKVWEAIKGFFSAAWDFIKGIWEGVTGFFSGIWNGIKNVFSNVGGWFKEKFTQANENSKKAWSTAKDWAGKAWGKVKEGFSGVGNWFKEQFEKGSKNSQTAMSKLKGFASSAWSGVKGVFSKVGSFFSDTFSKAWNKVKNIFSTGGKIFTGIKEGIVSSFKNIVNGIIGGINKVVSIPFNAINSVLNGIRNINILGVQPFTWVGTISVPQIPKLYEGAVLEKGEVGLLEGNGAEAVVPLHNNKKWIRAVANDMEGTIGNSNIDEKLDRLINLLTNYLPIMSNQQVVLSTGELVGALTSPLDKSLGELAESRRRGR